jgi:hypothetical protein
VTILISLLLAQAAPGIAADPATMPGIEDQIITVTGVNVAATREALERCLARRCPPAVDIELSMTHAEAQLIAGDTKGARRTLIKSRGRNKRYAASLPVPVSNLLALDADVASLDGLKNYARIGNIDALSALRKGLSPDNRRIAMQRLVIGQVFMREGRFDSAVRMFDAVAKRAKASNWPDVQGSAMFLGLSFYAIAASVNPAYADEARRRYAALRSTTDPAMAPMRDGSVALEIKLALTGKNADIDAVLAKAKVAPVKTPFMVAMPPLILPAALPGGQWVDFAFRINRQGGVEDVEPIARAPNASGGWIGQAGKALAGRRYLPLDLPPDSPGLWRRERLMIVADRIAGDRSLMRTERGQPKLRMIDLSNDDTVSTAGSATPGPPVVTIRP